MLRAMIDQQIARINTLSPTQLLPDVERQIPGRTAALIAAYGGPEIPGPVGPSIREALVLQRCGDPWTRIRSLPALLDEHWASTQDHRLHGAVRFGQALGLAQTVRVSENAASTPPSYRALLEWLTLFGIDAVYRGTLDSQRGLLDAVSELITKEAAAPIIEAIRGQAQYIAMLPQLTATLAPWSFDAQIAALAAAPLAALAREPAPSPGPHQPLAAPRHEPGQFFFPDRSFALSTPGGIVIAPPR